MIKTIAKTGLDLTRIAASDVQRRYLAQVWPALPRTINLLANDICNSRCTMCHIWQQKRDTELTPDQLQQILNDKLFAKVRHVGITGGEPTLRPDLPDLFQSACTTLPAMQSAGLITNAIRTDDVINRTIESASRCHAHGVTFNAMVSLDGVGELHDRVRGKAGNFDSAVTVINTFKHHELIDLSIGATITKQNVWHVDELFEWCRDRDLYVRFRVAEFIKRLYNQHADEHIRNFDDAERYHLATFFKKLELVYETSERVRRTYHSISQMLMGAKRRTTCPYQARDVVLDCRGNLQYCAPKSRSIGQTLKSSAITLFKRGLAERRRILREHCDDCIHDYHAPITFKESVSALSERFWRKMIRIDWFDRVTRLPFARPTQVTDDDRQGANTSSAAATCKHLLITGWYGTETVGDKAILGGIISRYRAKFPGIQITVSSLHPLVTQQTLRELNATDISIVPVYSARFAQAAGTACETIMGGGPLMDIEALAVPLWAFGIAKRFGKRTVIDTCGVGPLNKPRYIDTLKKIVALSDRITVRDHASAKRIHELTGRAATVAPDPAIAYVRTLLQSRNNTENKPVLACFLRAWPSQYAGNLTEREFKLRREAFEANLASHIRRVCVEEGLQPILYPMHSFVVGNDDRQFNRKFAREHLSGLDPIVWPRCSSVGDIANAMREAKHSLCMRYHAVVFAQTLGVDFTAIDYTNGGKIAAFLDEVGESDRGIALNDVIDGQLASWGNRNREVEGLSVITIGNTKGAAA